MAMAHVRKTGFFIGGPIPPGCRVEPAEHGRRRLVRNEHGDLVAGIWQQILAGDSLRDVARTLTVAGVPSGRRGEVQPWATTAVRRLLMSPQVVGVLVDAPTQLLVREALGRRRAPGRAAEGEAEGRLRKGVSPLTGIVRCPSCLAAMKNVTATGKGGTYRYLRCTNRTKGTCRQVDLRADRLEADVCIGLAEVCQSGGAYAQVLERDLAAARERVVAAREQMAAVRGEREQVNARVADMVLHQRIGTPTWEAAMQALNTELERLIRRQAELEAILAAASIDEASVDLVLGQVAGVIQHLDRLPLEQQHQHLRALLATVTLDMATDELVFELYEPDLSETPAPPEGSRGSSKT